MKKELLFNKIKKLLNLTTEKGATDAEAQSAFSKVQELALKYNLCISEIELTKSKEKVIEEQLNKIPMCKAINRLLLHVISMNFRTEIYFISKGKIRAVIVGLTKDVEITKQVFLSAFEFINSKSKQINDFTANKSLGVNSYKIGFIVGLKQSFKNNLDSSELKNDLISSGLVTTSLEVIQPYQVTEYMEQLNINKSLNSKSTNCYDEKSPEFRKGYFDGKSFHYADKIEN